MKSELYEDTYRSSKHFSFGKNWQEFLRHATPKRLAIAKQSLVDFLGGEAAIRGKTFIDVGCGSGIFSLAAYQLGARRVVSIDVDEYSLACARLLKDREGNPDRWQVESGSALSRQTVEQLGVFDVVYSWGVLHHTGSMEAAILNVCQLVAPRGVFYVAIYNENRTNLIHGTSTFWTRVKRFYNQQGPFVKRLLYLLYANYLFFGLLLTGQQPGVYIHNYQSTRGMSWRHDILDWLGGYPYESAAPDRLVNMLASEGFACSKLTYRNTIACNEYLFVRLS